MPIRLRKESTEIDLPFSKSASIAFLLQSLSDLLNVSLLVTIKGIIPGY